AHHPAIWDGFKSTGVARVAIVHLLIFLAPRQANLLGVDNDHKIAAVKVGAKGWLVLAAQQRRDLSRQTAERLIGGIHHIPVALDLRRLLRIRLHTISSG